MICLMIITYRFDFTVPVLDTLWLEQTSLNTVASFNSEVVIEQTRVVVLTSTRVSSVSVPLDFYV